MHLQFFYSVVIANSKLDETGPLYYFEYNFFLALLQHFIIDCEQSLTSWFAIALNENKN